MHAVNTVLVVLAVLAAVCGAVFGFRKGKERAAAPPAVIDAGEVDNALAEATPKLDTLTDGIKAAKIDVHTVEGPLHFPDCIGWFKNVNLNPETDTPFMMRDAKLKEMLAGIELSEPIAKPCAVMLAVYNKQTDEVSFAQIIQCDQLDEETAEVFGADELVKLS